MEERERVEGDCKENLQKKTGVHGGGSSGFLKLMKFCLWEVITRFCLEYVNISYTFLKDFKYF